MTKTAELLAPVGNWGMLNTAINSGADAVYLGLQNFNARMSADNFNDENIKDCVKLCHSHGIRVFVTLNTLANNDEMKQVLETVKTAVEAKVDAFIVQDFGIVNVLKNCFEGIELHASTQMGIHNLEGAKIAESLGIKRIVLSRETKLEDIKQIHKNTNLELEFFVQGALCVAFSGNCYFSSFMQDESGNRGRCKQFCRMKYVASTDKNCEEQYLLSARDLCLIENLKELIDAGICSFKIEGRLRREGYVAQTVQSYRLALDCLKNNKIFDINKEKFLLKKVFSRGDFLERAYLDTGVPDDVINPKTQNHLGIFVGKVLDVKPFKDLFKVTINSTHKLSFGDGLKFLDGEKQMFSLGVGNVEELGNNNYNIFTKHKIKPGFNVNLILDSVFEENLLKKTKKIDFSAQIFAFAGKPISCTLESENVKTTFEGCVLEPAKNAPTTKEEIETQFKKLGTTDFNLTKLEISCDNVFVPKSVLNGFRRNALEMLKNKIIDSFEKNINVKTNEKEIDNYKKFKAAKTDALNKNVLIFDEDNFEQLKQNKEFLKDSILIFSPQNFAAANFDDFEKEFDDFEIGLNLPIIANFEDTKIIKNILEKHKNFWVVANNLWGFCFAKIHKLIAGTNMNVFSDFSKQTLQNLGAKICTLSIEQELKNVESEFLLYGFGFATLMTFAHCPFKTLNKNSCQNCTFDKSLFYSDINQNKFKIRRIKLSQCYFELLNSNAINNIGLFKEKMMLDLRNIDDEKLKQIAKNLSLNNKLKLFKNEINGKIFKQVL